MEKERAWKRWGKQGGRVRMGRMHYHAVGRPVKGSGLGAGMLGGRWGGEKGPAHGLVSSGGGVGG